MHGRLHFGSSAVAPLWLALLACVACEPAPRVERIEEVPMNEPALKQQLETLQGGLFYFGHQSVGGNLLQGVQDLAEAQGVTLAVTEVAPTVALPGAGIAHEKVGSNGRPDLKLEAFEARLRSAELAPVRLAAVKLCYADIGRDADVEALFARYVRTVDALAKARPELTLLHVTTPLTARGDSLRLKVQRALGMAPATDAANLRRHRYNEQLRKRYGGERLFDLARLEASAPDGSLRLFGAPGAEFPALVEAYTDDGGHLNATGRRRLATAFVAWLAHQTVAAAVPR
jgi:hypothetical protein